MAKVLVVPFSPPWIPTGMKTRRFAEMPGADGFVEAVPIG
jgi:hypothetical protein